MLPTGFETCANPDAWALMRREALREYVSASLWVLPTVAAAIALVVGAAVSTVTIGPGSPLAALAFQGTAADARTLLTTITGTVVTVIALVLGLSVVALQLSSTQFSPRLLRNFLRDRPNQVVLSVFLATFSYSAAGLYTVGVSAGARTQNYPRLAVSGSIALLFASLAMVVYFADHLAHSIQIDAIARRVEQATLKLIHANVAETSAQAPDPPAWAVSIRSSRSGYVQTAHPELILPLASQHDVSFRLRPRVGEHVVAGTVLAWIWRSTDHQPAPPVEPFCDLLDAALAIGFERTVQQDVAFGIRQLVDVACKALSPAVNDPYTAVQAVDHLSVIFGALAGRPLGPRVLSGENERGVVIVPARQFGDYLSTMCGLIRRYGSHEPTVSLALLRLLESAGALVGDQTDRLDALTEQAHLILTAAERAIALPADLTAVRLAADRLQQQLQTGRTPARNDVQTTQV